MNKEELKEILFNYKRNLKRIRHLEEKYYSIQSIKYDKDRVQTNKGNKEVEQKVISLLSDPEYIELDHNIKAVERVKERLDIRQEIVFEEYFINRKSIRWISINRPVSNRTTYREIDRILVILQEEIEKK